MTRARALKRTIRARAAKTGERYTTARRHVLKEFDADTATPPDARLRLVTPPRSAPTITAPANVSRGGLSDTKARERTGHGLEHWFAVLDAFAAVEKGHTAAARHLHDVHGVDGWYAQGITVAYERARGVRAVNQRRSGEYEVSVSKVVVGDVPAVIAALTNARHRREWTAQAPAAVVEEFTAALGDKTTKGFTIRPNGQGRFRYRARNAVVEFYLDDKSRTPSGRAAKANDVTAPPKVSIVVRLAKLPSAASVIERRTQWKGTLAAVAAHLQATRG